MIPYSLNPMGIDPVAELSDLDILRQIRDANPTSQLPSLWSEDKDPYTQWECVMFGNNIELDQYAASNFITVPPISERVPNKVYAMSIGTLGISSIPLCNKLSELRDLNCCENNISSLDLSGLNKLQSIWCSGSNINTINITGLGDLRILDSSVNKLTNINIVGLNELKWVIISGNKINSLDVSGLTKLESLTCDNNMLYSIDGLISKGNITYYDFKYNNFPTAELDRFRALGFTDESMLLPQKT